MFLLQLEQGGDSTARPGEDQDPGLGPSAGHSLLAAVLQSWQLSDLDALGFDMCGMFVNFVVVLVEYVLPGLFVGIVDLGCPLPSCQGRIPLALA